MQSNQNSISYRKSESQKTCVVTDPSLGMTRSSLTPPQAPISVYTSGKGSSAAGLTATVIKDNSGEFFLEVYLGKMLAPSSRAASAYSSPQLPSK